MPVAENLAALKRRLAVARGEAPADLVIKNARLLNVLSGEIHVTEMQVVRPELNVRIDDKGAFEWMAAEGGKIASLRHGLPFDVDALSGPISGGSSPPRAARR